MEPALEIQGETLAITYNIGITQHGVIDDAARVFAASKTTWNLFRARFPNHLEFGVRNSHRRRLYFDRNRDMVVLDAESLYALGQWLVPLEFGLQGLLGAGGFGPALDRQILTGFSRQNLRVFMVPIHRVRLLAGVTTHNLMLNEFISGNDNTPRVNLVASDPAMPPINGRIAALHQMRERLLRELMALWRSGK
ncbi:uncharacterized protein PAC_19014 [Phialocephala subalpina]|uniref:Uncharacterized protein n=1 Tax=Phialocephala subalpina TaxID=576137 RepID=A0A1L7XVP8_9HELO|nr:uncharacterized protein PAC_19014 [Phialocephala subalpina]